MNKISNEEIALRLVEAWGRQQGLPAGFQNFKNNYFDMLKKLKEKQINE